MNFAENRLKKLKKLNIILIVMLGFFAASCNVGPEPINYGQDGCSHCKMTISDTRFGAEIVTAKGKIYKFDAAECMLQFVKKGNVKDISQYLVVDVMQPGTLIKAKNAHYLISENLPSPMGGNINAFNNEQQMSKAFEEHGGKKLNWQQLQDLY